MEQKEDLLSHLDRVHTTSMGADRIRKNLGVEAGDVVSWCVDRLSRPDCRITRKGKNWYAQVDGCIFTVNAYSFTIITAHRAKEEHGPVT